MMTHCKKYPTEAETKPFLKTLWNLESFDISGEIIKPPENQVFSIKFLDDSTFSGKSDCNEINGNFIVSSDNSLSINKVGTTKIYCGSASLDEKYFEALNDIISYEIVNDKLYIYCNNNAKLNFQGE
jgi:heat shock protein HslJ